jgi:NitT/TauT family transport system substrate-binding protein
MITKALRAGTLSLLLAGASVAGVAAARAETITVTHWGSAFYGAPYAVALEKGFFKKRGLDITGFLTSAGGGTSVRNTLAGEVPFGEVALPAAILAIQSGQPLKIISGGVESVEDILWITQPDGKFNSLADMKGKKVAYTAPGSVTNMIILNCLQKAGLEQKDVQLVAAGDLGANLSAVLNRAVDAAMSGEPLWSENQGKVKAAFWAKDCTNPAMTQTVGITTADFAKTGGEKLRGLIDARREAVEYIKAHPEEAADIVAKAYSGDPKLYRDVFKHFVSFEYFGDGRLHYDNMNRMLDGMKLVGRLKAPVDWKQIVDPSFLPKDLQATQ